MYIFKVNFYEPSRSFHFWSDDFIYINGDSKVFFCTLAFSLLVK